MSMPSSPKKKLEVLSSLGFVNGCCCGIVAKMLLKSMSNPAPSIAEMCLCMECREGRCQLEELVSNHSGGSSWNSENECK